MTAPSEMVIGAANDRTTKGCGRERLVMRGRPGRGARGCRRAFVTASLSLVIARHDGGRVREACWFVEPWRAGDATHSRVAGAGQGPVAGAAIQSSAGRPPVRVRWWLARPAAMSAASACSTRSAGRLRWQRSRIWLRVSPSGERASAAWICSASGSPVACPSAQAAERCGVVPERERGVEMLGLDRLLAVEQCVEKREPDDVRLGAGGELAVETGCGLGQLRVGLPPQLARVRRELTLPAVWACLSTLAR